MELIGAILILVAIVAGFHAVQAADKDVAARDREMKGEGRG